jgi:hypothetical protein
MRVRATVGLVLLLASGLLTACREDESSTKTGDLIQAQEDNQFRSGQEATVVLPTGRLLIHSAEPVDSANADETRGRETIDAPSGTVLVPISWQYDTWGSDRLVGIMAATETPTVDLITDGEDYRLPPPDRANRAGESFYVVVDGDAEERELRIEFDGVVQTVDLADGRTDKGDAAALYEIGDEKLKQKPCDDPTDHPWFDSFTVAAEFSCALVGPVLTPYAAGRWAPDGSVWLALTVTTELRAYGETNRLGGGARYAARAVEVTPEIDGEPPARVVTTDSTEDVCPIGATATCGWSRHVVFEVPADDAEQGPLDLEVAYKLTRVVQWGGFDPPLHKKIKATETFKIWGD